MDNAPVCSFVLEMYEPIFFSVGSVYPAALMRTVNIGIALCHYGTGFVGTPYVLGAEHYLPTRGYAAGRRKDIIVSVAFIHFCAFDGCITDMSVVNDPVRTDR